MLTSITPLGERSRNFRWAVTAGAFVVASTIAGAIIGGLAGAIGSAAGLASTQLSVRLVVLAAAALIGASLDLGIFGLRLPTIGRQVNEDWMRTYRGWVYGAGFGAQLGGGLFTVVNTSAIYLSFLAAFLGGSAILGVLIGACFGFVRAASILFAAGVDTPAKLLSLGQRLLRWGRPVARATVTAQIVLTLLALLTVIG